MTKTARSIVPFLLWLGITMILLSQGCTTTAPSPSGAVIPSRATTWLSTALPSVTPSPLFPPPTASPLPPSTFTPQGTTPAHPTAVRTVNPRRSPQLRAVPTSTFSNPTSIANRPTQVMVRRDSNQFQLMVNDQVTYVTGMNYNVDYTVLPLDEQLARHRRDFKIMRDAGVNAIIGWGIYDETTLRVAEEFGIGVIMPFDLDPEGAYDNADYCNEIKSNFKDYVLRFRNFPAVWGWNPGGDELVYRMVTEEHRTVDKLQAAVDFELELAQLAYALDPKHINVIKEPRDWYIKYLTNALYRAKSKPGYQDLRSSLVYGINVYGHPDDIELALTNGKLTLTGQLGLAMLVTEFGPFNSPRTERATNYAALWDVVARISDLGGLVYVFGPDQPNPQVANPYDVHTLLPNEYSLVDMNGQPVDGALATLTAKWRELRQASPTATPIR